MRAVRSPCRRNTHDAHAIWECRRKGAVFKKLPSAAQAWTQKLKTGMSKRAASGESIEAAHDGAASPQRMEQQRSHGISSKALHHGATAYPSEMQLQQVRPTHTHGRKERRKAMPCVHRKVAERYCVSPVDRQPINVTMNSRYSWFDPGRVCKHAHGRCSGVSADCPGP